MRRGIWGAKDGVLFGEPPYGWKLSSDHRHLVLDPAEQRVIAIVRHMRAEGRTIREIVEELEELGVLTRRGRPFGVAGVHRMVNTEGVPREAKRAR